MLSNSFINLKDIGLPGSSCFSILAPMLPRLSQEREEELGIRLLGDKLGFRANSGLGPIMGSRIQDECGKSLLLPVRPKVCKIMACLAVINLLQRSKKTLSTECCPSPSMSLMTTCYGLFN